MVARRAGDPCVWARDQSGWLVAGFVGIDRLPGGGGIIAAVEADAGKEPRIYLLITPKDAGLLDRASRVVLEMARGDAAAKGKPDPVMTTEHRGLKVYASGGTQGGAYAMMGGRLV